MQYANLEIWDDTSDFDWLLFSLECQWESPLSKPSSGRLNLANSTSKYALRSSAREALLRLPDLDPIADGVLREMGFSAKSARLLLYGSHTTPSPA